VVTPESASPSARYGFRPGIANRDVWIEELQLRTGSQVRLEHVDEQFGDETVTAASGVVVAALPWRDLSLSES
jgi:hypothetical protein